MVALMDDFIGNINRNSFITISKIKCVKEDTVFHAFKIVFPIVSLQGILIVKLIGSHERLELEVLIFNKLRQFFQEFWAVFLDIETIGVIISFFFMRTLFRNKAKKVIEKTPPPVRV